jgi:hypothetical protein
MSANRRCEPRKSPGSRDAALGVFVAPRGRSVALSTIGANLHGVIRSMEQG